MANPAQDRSNEPDLLRDENDGVTTLTLNRPRQFNALTENLVAELHDALKSAAEDKHCRVVVIAAAGKAFCTGHDVKEMAGETEEDFFKDAFAHSAQMMLTMMKMPQPVIARVHGLVTAGGCQLVASCDMAVASTSASFATNGISNGLFCSTPSVPLSRGVPRKAAFEMLFTGEFVDARRALEIGLVNQVVPDDSLDDAVARIAAQIKAKPARAIASGKAMFYEQLQMPIETAFDYAGSIMARDVVGEDAREGFAAFIDKRKPNWH